MHVTHQAGYSQSSAAPSSPQKQCNATQARDEMQPSNSAARHLPPARSGTDRQSNTRRRHVRPDHKCKRNILASTSVHRHVLPDRRACSVSGGQKAASAGGRAGMHASCTSLRIAFPRILPAGWESSLLRGMWGWVRWAALSDLRRAAVRGACGSAACGSWLGFWILGAVLTFDLDSKLGFWMLFFFICTWRS